MSTDHPPRAADADRLNPARSLDGDLTTRFTYHPPEPEQPEVYQLIRDLAHLLALLIETAAFPSRERSLAVTKAEETVMWANAAIARVGLRDAAYAGARDLLDLTLEQLRTAKPDSVVIEDAGTDDTTKGEAVNDPWAKDYADGNPMVFHEGKVAPDAFMPLIVSLDAADGLQVRNPEVLNGRGVLVLPDGIGVDWQAVLSAFGATP